MNKKVYRVAALLVLSSFLLSSCKEKKEPVKQPELLVPVNTVDNTEVATYRDIFDVKTYSANVSLDYKVLAFSQDGTFDTYKVAIGDNVKKGQVLASLSDELYENELEQLQQSYDDLQSNYQDNKKLKELEFKIIKEKLKAEEKKLKNAKEEDKTQIKYNIEKLKIDRKNIEDEIAISKSGYDADVKIYKNKIQLLKDKMSSNDIVAPFDGIIAYEEKIERGSFINSETPIMRILDTSQKYITCEMSLVSMVENSSKYYAVINGKQYDLKYKMASVNDAQNSLGFFNVNCKFTLVNEDDSLQLGDSGLIYFFLKNKENVLSVTNDAIYSEGMNKFYVYCINDNQKEKVYVETGLVTALYTEIKSGLKEGDVVVVE